MFALDQQKARKGEMRGYGIAGYINGAVVPVMKADLKHTLKTALSSQRLTALVAPATSDIVGGCPCPRIHDRGRCRRYCAFYITRCRVGVELPRAAAHEDINLLTILPASDGCGLSFCLVVVD